MFGQIRRLCENNRLAAAEGMAALEFALLAPVMILLLASTQEISQAITIDRRIAQIASSVADLVARERSTTGAEIDGIMRIGGHLLRPYDGSRLRVTILNVIANVDNSAQTSVCWSYSHNRGTGPFQSGQTYELPAGIVEAGNSVIVAEVIYDYQAPIFGALTAAILPLRARFYLKPRLSSYVEYEGARCP